MNQEIVYTTSAAQSRWPELRTQILHRLSFYINQRTNLRLDWSPGTPGYTVFGEVISGMNVVDWIATAKTKKWGGFCKMFHLYRLK